MTDSLARAAFVGAMAKTNDPRFKGRPSMSLSSDVGFGQYMEEMTTAVKYDMNITHVMLNNHELGKISKEQRAGNGETNQTSLHNPDFSRFSDNYGALSIRSDFIGV